MNRSLDPRKCTEPSFRRNQECSRWFIGLQAAVMLLAMAPPAMAHSVEPRYALSGTVTSAVDGEPIANAEVALTTGSPSYIVDETTTDAAGGYRFDIVHGGLYGVLVISAPGHLPEAFGDVICPLEGCYAGLGQAIALSDQPHVDGIDFALEPPALLTGSVRDAATGHGLAGTEIIVTIENEYRSFFTESTGEFSLALPPGDARVVASDSGYQDQIYPGQACGQSISGRPDCDPALGAVVTLSTGETSSGIDFALARGASVSGRVVEQPSGAPIAGTWVEIHDDGRLVKRALSGNDGSYIVGGLPAGVFNVLTSTREGPHLDELYGGRFCYRFGLRLYCDRTSGDPVTVATDQATTRIDFGLARGSLITGRVIDAASGEALVGQRINIYDDQGRWASSTVADDSGSYASRGLPAGTYLALASTPDFSTEQAGQAYDGRVCHPHCDAAEVLAGGNWTPIVLGDGADRTDVDFDLLRPAAIAGRITDAATGQGLAGAQVHIQSRTSISGGHMHADENGRYEIGGLWNESYSVRAQVDGYLHFIYPGVVTGGLFEAVTATIGERVSGIDIAMASGGAIKARVTLPGSAAGLDARATVFDAEGNSVLEKAISEDDGILAPLPPGEYFVQIERGGVTITYPDILCAAACDPTAGTPVIVEDVRFTNIFFSFPNDISAGCVPGPTTLCLQDGRFSAGIEFRRADGTLASARVEELTDETGYFWFFGPDNIEVVLKVLDACNPPFDRFWVFAAGLTNVETLLTVTDTATGAEKTYTNVAGSAFEPILDTDAFNTCSPSGLQGAGAEPELAKSAESFLAEMAAVAGTIAGRQAKSACADGTLCLQDERFEVTATWTTDAASGTAKGVPLTSDSGYFWFFDADNVEIVLKVLDACAPPYERFWVFAAGLTNVEVELRVRDTASDQVRTYRNLAGSAFQPILDTQAFATCTAEDPP